MLQRNWPAYVGLALLWGLTLTLMRHVVGTVGWGAGVPATSLAVAVAIALFAVGRGRQLDWRLGWPRILLLGAAVAVQNVGIAVAIDRAGIALTAVALGAVPLFGSLFGQVWGLDRITFRVAAGLVTGFLGLLVVVGFPADGSSWGFISGMLAGLLAAIAAAYCLRYVEASRKLAGRIEAASASYFVAGLLTVPLAFAFPGPGGAGVIPWLLVAVLGVLVAGAGHALDFVLADRTDTDSVARAKALGMVIAVLIGVLLFGEALSMGQWLGVVLLIVGGALVLGLFPSRSSTARRR